MNIISYYKTEMIQSMHFYKFLVFGAENDSKNSIIVRAMNRTLTHSFTTLLMTHPEVINNYNGYNV